MNFSFIFEISKKALYKYNFNYIMYDISCSRVPSSVLVSWMCMCGASEGGGGARGARV